MLRRGDGVRACVFAAHMERAAVAYMTARMRTFAVTLRVDDARFKIEAPRFADFVEVDYRERPRRGQQSSPVSRRQIFFGWKSVRRSGVASMSIDTLAPAVSVKSTCASAPLHIQAR